LEKLIILGNGSATATLHSHPSAQVLYHNNEIYLIDCGEATQYQLLRYKIKTSKITKIFISHLHGDHYFGLIGLISSFNLAQRQNPLTIYGPNGLQDIIVLQLKHSQTQLHFPLHFECTNTEAAKCIYISENISIHSIALYHRIPCFGFVFRATKPQYKLIKEKLTQAMTPADFHTLQNGQNVLHADNSIKYLASQFCREMPLASYGYCSDTQYNPLLCQYIEGIQYLYHEATFSNADAARASKTNHSTAAQAAQIAKQAAVGKLLLGHFSSRYTNTSELLQEAKEVFEQSQIGEEGLEIYF
jgi:ribonuclease Z